jgi:NAD(P)-dependent dehydrogenase (short-subunit alcohol dehydrogenase family)
MGIESSDLEGKVAIVTGAGQGIGRGIALALAAHGARLVLTGRTMDKLEAVEAEILQRNGKATSVAGDVALDDDVAR